MLSIFYKDAYMYCNNQRHGDQKTSLTDHLFRSFHFDLNVAETRSFPSGELFALSLACPFPPIDHFTLIPVVNMIDGHYCDDRVINQSEQLPLVM